MASFKKIHVLINLIIVCSILLGAIQSRKHHKNNRHGFQNQFNNDLSLWISEAQVKKFSGYAVKIFAIDYGKISSPLMDPNINQYMPKIPSEMSSVNFTWESGRKKYRYNFYKLHSLNENILNHPTLSIKSKGRVPREASDFVVYLTCNGNSSGIAMFTIELQLITGKNVSLPGTPLKLNIRKECAHRGVYDRSSLTSSLQGPDPDCDHKCINGRCNDVKICLCNDGYMGQYCETALCFPDCMNGGNCTAPAVCSCPKGYQGTHCEGGICAEKCLNGGKCIQKDTCKCQKGYYGFRCEFSKCVIPCMNGGKCVGNNKCRCPPGLGGSHCEIGRRQRSVCKKPCRHGQCMPNRTCSCNKGYFGRYCNQRKDRMSPIL